ncbi:MAG: ABC transporter permease [Deltaproteobacteria bacterium]|nr:ABC transporter permease [Deltaproteobacteria bacterium]
MTPFPRSEVKSFFGSLAVAALLLVGILLLTLLILLVSGAPPFTALKYIFMGSLGSWQKVAQVLRVWVPLCLCACGLLFSFRIGLWNIGIEGQVVAGAIFATAIMRLGTEHGPSSVILFSAFLGGVVGGSLWAIMTGFLKTRAGVNEIFAGLGLNFVALGISLWLIFGPWKRPGVASMSGTEPFPPSLWLPVLKSLRLSPVGLLLALAGVLLTAWMLGRTRLGLALKGIGNNPKAAYLHGLKPGTYIILAMGIAGAFAGMAGVFQVVGVYHRLIPSISSNYGYLALLVVMLADYRVWPAPVIAFFFASLNVGSIQLPMMLQLDSSLSGIIQGSLVLATLLLQGYRKRRNLLAHSLSGYNE